MKRYRWLFFDADNTLFDFSAAEDNAITRTLTRFGAPATEELKAVYRACNHALWSAFERGEITQSDILSRRFPLFLETAGISGDGDAWGRCYVEALAASGMLLPGAPELCRKASEHYILALATNGIPFIQRSRLAGSPLPPYFGDRVFISGEMGVAKPDPRFFGKMLEALVPADRYDQVLVIGDSLSSDIRGAVNAGLDSLWLNPAGASPTGVSPTYQVSGLEELGRFLEDHHF